MTSNREEREIESAQMREEIHAFVSENADLVARILRSGSPEAQAMALALLANTESDGSIDTVDRKLRELGEA